MILEKIRSYIVGKAPLIYLVSEEEERVERIIAAAAEKAAGGPWHILVWSCINGLTRGKERIDPSTDPAKALNLFLRIKEPSLLVFKDLHLFLDNNPPLVRQLKDAARVLHFSPKKIFFICPRVALPQDMFSIFKIEDVPLPRYEELAKILDTCLRDRPQAEALQKSLSGDLKDKLVRAAMGFTATEASDVFHMACMGRTKGSLDMVDQVLAEKSSLVRKSGVLEFIGGQDETWDIGGLANLKKWLRERGSAFSPEAAKHGLNPPKGILVMGVSGCGKSLCIKAAAVFWKLPLLRLDMGRIYDGLAGPPEEAMRKAIKTAEAVAPCVLWIDEIEAGIANQQQKQAGGNEARVLAIFLTWMQEKTAPVFVGATANEVEVLPPEILRKGRFDELFYMGLPTKDERAQILAIHMKKRHVDPTKFDVDYLAASTEGLNGAEIEQGIISALFEAQAAKGVLTEHILANTLRNTVPLSRTMRERIQKIEAWARDRAMKASPETL
jgi:ATP-dependent 26S proteasome regulatory subunit